MISQTAEYALRAIVFLGNQQGTARTTVQIGEAIDAPAGYLAKVMRQLSRAGIVGGQRGPLGGFTLTKDPVELTILEVVQAVDVLRRITNCPLGQPAHDSGLCPLHRRMDDVLAAAEKTFGQTTVGELLDGPRIHNLCSFPCVSELIVNPDERAS